jgi:hypothetical protein
VEDSEVEAEGETSHSGSHVSATRNFSSQAYQRRKALGQARRAHIGAAAVGVQSCDFRLRSHKTQKQKETKRKSAGKGISQTKDCILGMGKTPIQKLPREICVQIAQ